MAWDSLLDLLRDPSQLGQRVGTGWLTRLLIAAAEAELQASARRPRDAGCPLLLSKLVALQSPCFLESRDGWCLRAECIYTVGLSHHCRAAAGAAAQPTPCCQRCTAAAASWTPGSGGSR